MVMRKSRVLRRMRAGKVARCVKLNLADPRAVEIAAMMGFDVVWLDMEHIATDWSFVEHAVRAAKVYDTDVMVRVAKGSYSDYVRPLEADASGIMIPHLMSFEEAQEVVRTTRFHPLGRRPWDGGNQDGAYTMVPSAEYIRTANEERFVCVQIEDPEPLDELDRIARLPGIDMILFGPGDFSQGIGDPGNMDNPEIARVRKLIAETCVKHGKFAATVGGPDTYADYVAMGYRFLNLGADVVALSQYFGSILERVDQE